MNIKRLVILLSIELAIIMIILAIGVILLEFNTPYKTSLTIAGLITFIGFGALTVAGSGSVNVVNSQRHTSRSSGYNAGLKMQVAHESSKDDLEFARNKPNNVDLPIYICIALGFILFIVGLLL